MGVAWVFGKVAAYSPNWGKYNFTKSHDPPYTGPIGENRDEYFQETYLRRGGLRGTKLR